MASKETLREVMTTRPIVLDASASVCDAAKAMRENDVGDVLVRRNGKLCGIVTDRDIVVRVLAEEQDPSATTLAEICTDELVCLAPDCEIGDAVEVMAEKAIRRIPVVDENDQALGIVSLGDLAIERDRQSALGKISAAPPSH